MELLFISLHPTLIALVSVLLFSYFLRRRWGRPPYGAAAKRNSVPMAPGRWPVIGHIHLFEKLQLSHKTLGAMADKYGPIFTIQLGLNSGLVVSNWEMAKECLYKNDAAVSSRIKTTGQTLLSFDFGMFSFSLDTNAHWREMRKIAMSELLSNRRVDELKHVVFSEIQTSLIELYKTWEEKKDSESGQVLVDLKSWFENLTLNVILILLVGKRYFGSKAEVDEEERKEMKKALEDFASLVGQDLVGDYIPYVGWLDLGGYVNAMKRTAKELDKLAGKWLEEHKRNRASGMSMPKAKQDFMDKMLSLLDGKEISGFDSDKSIKATTMILVFGGTQTSNVTLTWATSFLLNNPHILKTAQKELDMKVGRDRLLNESDVTNLPYLQAIVKETLRLNPSVPILSFHKFNKDCTVAGYHVPEGTRLLVNLWKIHTDPRVWPDPLEFKPDRFLTTHRDRDVKGNDFELIPFGGGRRICPGISFGLQTVTFALSALLQAFDIGNPSTDRPVEMSGRTGLTNPKATPLFVKITPRLSFSPLN